MTIRNLDALFRPNAIALVGASNQPNTVGAVLARNLFEAGFRGPILTGGALREGSGRSSCQVVAVEAAPLDETPFG